MFQAMRLFDAIHTFSQIFSAFKLWASQQRNITFPDTFGVFRKALSTKDVIKIHMYLRQNNICDWIKWDAVQFVRSCSSRDNPSTRYAKPAQINNTRVACSVKYSLRTLSWIRISISKALYGYNYYQRTQPQTQPTGTLLARIKSSYVSTSTFLQFAKTVHRS